MSVLQIDYETRSTVDLPSTGVYPYAEHPETDIWCMAWAFDDEEPEVWVRGDPIPARIVAHVEAGGQIRAWNAAFERAIWREIMVPRYGAPEVRDAQWYDTMADAAALSLPLALDRAAEVLGVDQQKDNAGKDLMRRMAKPRKIHPDGRIEWWDVPERLAKLYAYAKQDVRTERAAGKVLNKLGAYERRVYLLDQRINDRGVRVDRPLILAAKQMAEAGVAQANAALWDLTAGEVGKVTNHARFKTWLVEQGVATDSVDKAAMRAMLNGELGELSTTVRAAVQTRAESGKTSLAKLDAMLNAAGPDDRVRGAFQYHAASTGRWGGRLMQPHNFPRPELDDPEAFLPDILAGDYAALDVLVHPVTAIVSGMRSMLIAGEGMDFLGADFSAIEARVLNWLADERDVLENFRRYDAGDKSYDPYVRNAMVLYALAYEEVQKFPHRQTGKFQELGCGYGMGWAKAVSAAKATYQLTLTEEEAKRIVANYRSTHERVVAFWYESERAAVEAVEHPGRLVKFGPLRNLDFLKVGAYLWLKLPSGRVLAYPAPMVREEPTPWGTEKATLSYMGVDQFTRQWTRQRTYGGKIVENIVQAVARDLLVEAMWRGEDAGLAPVLHVHDEAVCEVPEGEGDVAAYERLMAQPPTWAAGCPIAAEGWRGKRWRK